MYVEVVTFMGMSGARVKGGEGGEGGGAKWVQTMEFAKSCSNTPTQECLKTTKWL
jgi:hypothetical protein